MMSGNVALRQDALKREYSDLGWAEGVNCLPLIHKALSQHYEKRKECCGVEEMLSYFLAKASVADTNPQNSAFP